MKGVSARMGGPVVRAPASSPFQGGSGQQQRSVAVRRGAPLLVGRAIQPNKVGVQVVQESFEDATSATEPAPKPAAASEKKSKRRGRPRKVKQSDVSGEFDGMQAFDTAVRDAAREIGTHGATAADDGRGGGVASSTRGAEPVSGSAQRKGTRKSFSTFVKELFDAQASNERKESNAAEEDQGPTELIFKLTRRGYGWGEEIIPQLTVERRPVKGAASARRKKTGEMAVRDDDLEDYGDSEGGAGRVGRAVDVEDGTDGEQETSSSGSPETVLNTYLIDIGVPERDVERLVNSAVAWRMTPGGRPLIDRRRQSRLTRNVKIVTKYLVDKCGVPLGKDGVAAVFMKTPELMLCKPSNNDRWDRRAVELAAYLLKNGHCNVPEVYPENQELGMWVKRQRVTRAAGQLSQERLTILERMGFEFGDLAQVTEEWETRFDMLVDWVLWHGESGESFSWDLINWGKKGGITARELALWISLQREFYRRQLLPAEAVHRFEAVYSGWRDPGVSFEEDRWMEWLGRLVYVIERRRLAMRGPPTGRGNPFASQRAGSVGGKDDTSSRISSNSSGGGSAQDSRASVARKQVVHTVSSRRQAASQSPFSEDPGLRFWLSRQRWMWRKSKLDPERVKMLQLAGIDMDIYPADDWRRMAHLAAERLQGASIELPFISGTGQDRDADRDTDSEDDFPERGDVVAGNGNVVPSGNTRLRVLRWVETQRALFVDGRLSPGQLRYLTFLGLTWVLSDKVVDADDSIWLSKWKDLKTHLLEGDMDTETMPFEIQDWVSQQRAMNYLNMLDESRKSKLSSLGLDLGVAAPSSSELVWNLRLSELFVHSQEVGHADVAEDDRPELFAWLDMCVREYREDRLSPTKAAQLKSLGVRLGNK